MSVGKCADGRYRKEACQRFVVCRCESYGRRGEGEEETQDKKATVEGEEGEEEDSDIGGSSVLYTTPAGK